jgi:cellulose biosynthesis protein BcsQ
MAKSIAVAGKGGTGKTTIAALLVTQLGLRGWGPVLAPNLELQRMAIALAFLGGVLIPALIYELAIHHNPRLRPWFGFAAEERP